MKSLKATMIAVALLGLLAGRASAYVDVRVTYWQSYDDNKMSGTTLIDSMEYKDGTAAMNVKIKSSSSLLQVSDNSVTRYSLVVSNAAGATMALPSGCRKVVIYCEPLSATETVAFSNRSMAGAFTNKDAVLNLATYGGGRVVVENWNGTAYTIYVAPTGVPTDRDVRVFVEGYRF